MIEKIKELLLPSALKNYKDDFARDNFIFMGYLIYLGGSNLMHLEATEHRALIIVFSVLFIVVGAAYGLMTFRMMKQYQEEEEETETASPEEDGVIPEEESASLEDGILSEEEAISPDGEDRAE